MRFADAGEGYSDMLAVMNGLIPSHVVFNGRVGALTGDKALTAEQGETVLFVHSQANRDSRPHLIGGHGDLVWEAGKFNNLPERDLETWFIRGRVGRGGALYVPAARRLRLCEPQPDRGGEPWGDGACHRRAVTGTTT